MQESSRKIKKLIAKEGLIFISILFICLSLFYVCDYLAWAKANGSYSTYETEEGAVSYSPPGLIAIIISSKTNYYYNIKFISPYVRQYYYFKSMISFVLLYLYPFYLGIRLIIIFIGILAKKQKVIYTKEEQFEKPNSLIKWITIEVLVLCGFILVGLAFSVGGHYLGLRSLGYVHVYEDIREIPSMMFRDAFQRFVYGDGMGPYEFPLYVYMQRIGELLLLFGYPLHILIGFVFWAVRVLQTRDQDMQTKTTGSALET